jgi:hypothetical protein
MKKKKKKEKAPLVAIQKETDGRTETDMARVIVSRRLINQIKL